MDEGNSRHELGQPNGQRRGGPCNKKEREGYEDEINSQA
jgi:hypothetical protein